MLLTGTVSRITEQASITLTVSCTGLVLSCLDTSICVIFASFLFLALPTPAFEIPGREREKERGRGGGSYSLSYV